MAYARFANDCDVYVYADTRGGYACVRCPKIGGTFHCATAREMAGHLLREHRAKGHLVPDEAIEELKGEPDSETSTIDERWAADRMHKAEIVRRDDGLFQVWLYREVPGDGEYEREAYWSPVGRDVILADTLDRARRLAEEEVRLRGTGEDTSGGGVRSARRSASSSEEQ